MLKNLVEPDHMSIHISTEDGLHLLVICYILITPKIEEKDWLCTNIFPTRVLCEENVCNLFIDSGSCLNVDSKQAVDVLKFSTKKHPQSNKVACVNDNSIHVTKRCLVKFKLRPYEDEF